MANAIFYCWIALILFGAHVLITLFICLHLKVHLKGASLDSFKRILGVHYQRKPLKNGWTRYKWIIGLTVIRAGFNDHNKLMEYEIRPYSFLPASYRRSFVF